MRFLVLLLLVILLPLRGELGFAAAAAGLHHGQGMTQNDTAASPAAVSQEAASKAQPTAHDCAEHAHGHSAGQQHESEPQVAAQSASAQTADTACDACSACQTCHAVGLVLSAIDMASMPLPHAQPTSLSQHFASAPALRDQKPPIS